MNSPSPASSVSNTRLMSLDALRGFDMMWIVGGASIVKALEGMGDNAAARFLSTQLTHVDWEGMVFYDLIFPLFLFITGISMVFSLDKAIERGERGKAVKRILSRSLLLWVMGVIYHGGLSREWPDVQLTGVLQRIAVCYLFGALIYCVVRSPRGLVSISAGLLVGYWALLALVPFPNLVLQPDNVNAVAQEIGSSAPSDIAEAVPGLVSGVYEEGRNLTNYVDFRFLPGFKRQVYYINEGLLSVLPAIAYALLGALVGRLLKNASIPDRRKLELMIGGGLAAILVGLLWSLSFPLIKRIWTSSFVLTSIGISSLFMALFYYLVDMRGYRRWCQPFVWIGCNALTVYLGSRFVDVSLIAGYLTGGDVKGFFDTYVAQGAGGVFTALTGLLLIMAAARFLYKRKIFIRL